MTLVLDAGRVARLVGVRRLTVPEPLAADAVDLGRRVAAVLGLLVTQERRSAAALRRTLAPRLGSCGVRGSRCRHPASPGPPIAPSGCVASCCAVATLLLARGRARLRLGRLDAVLPAYAPGGVEHVGHDGVLRVAIDLVLDRRRPEETT